MLHFQCTTIPKWKYNITTDIAHLIKDVTIVLCCLFVVIIYTASLLWGSKIIVDKAFCVNAP